MGVRAAHIVFKNSDFISEMATKLLHYTTWPSGLGAEKTCLRPLSLCWLPLPTKTQSKWHLTRQGRGYFHNSWESASGRNHLRLPRSFPSSPSKGISESRRGWVGIEAAAGLHLLFAITFPVHFSTSELPAVVIGSAGEHVHRSL